MSRLALALLAAALLCALPSSAAAQQRAFVLTGSESIFRPDPDRIGVADTAVLADGSVAVLTGDSRVRVLDPQGRTRLIGRVPGMLPDAGDLDVLPDGALLVVADGRAWRIALDGTATPLTPLVRSGAASEVAYAAPAPDGSILLSLRNRIVRRAPDGAQTTLVGSGRDGELRPGPARSTPLEFAGELAPAPRGLVFASTEGLWRVDGGTLRRHAGGRRSFEEPPIPPGGARADRVSILGVSTISGDPDGELVAVTERGVYAIRGGIVREVVDAQPEPIEPRPPLWSGDPVARAWISPSGGAARTADGGWLVGADDGVVLLTAADGRSARLAVAVETTALATAASGAVRVLATRAATVRLRATAGGRRIAEVTAPVSPGANVLRLPEPLPAGPVTLSARATADDGAVARHSLTVLGTRAVSLGVARDALRLSAGVSDSFVSVRRCRSERPTRVSCAVSILDQDTGGATRRRQAVTLRPDGWLWVSGRGRARRVELLG